MTLVTPDQVSPNEEITDSSVNTPVNQLADVINGGIDDTNISGVSGTKLSAGTVSTAKLEDLAVTTAKVAAGFVVQVASGNFTEVATGTTLIPLDDTIPQNTEGNEYMTLAITPKSATNILVIEVVVFVSNSAANQNMIAALFQDTTASAIAATRSFMATATGVVTIPLMHRMVAGTTSATTFKVRVGAPNAGTTTFNGSGGSRFFGAITKSSIVITEYKA